MSTDDLPGGARVYGAEPGEPAGPEEGHDYRELVGGPLDGLLLDVTGWSPEQLLGEDAGVALICEVGRYGPGGRAHYAPRPAEPSKWDWEGDSA
ncbi:hypothetical protein ACIA8O_39980 [Kitasatospora sp. NPDC051853]|uniref:hypothetical protein n=1 Tax=Kitasatospora sp. NPDC051853 TaxID=3364058 RepID=UPI0037880B8E